MKFTLKKIRIILFALVAIGMLAVPLYMVIKGEGLLRKGAVYIFKTAPVDPYDAMRGRYVTLNFERNFIDIPQGNEEKLNNGDLVFLSLRKDKDGFADFSAISKNKPEKGDYIRLNISRLQDRRCYFVLPFNRFYMNEKLAPDAETAVFKASRMRSQSRCTATVRVYDGTAVVEDLFIDGVPIRDYIRKNKK